MLRATFKAAFAHKLRLALTALAVMLGVTFVSGTMIFTDTLSGVFTQMIDESTAPVDVYVQPKMEFETLTDYGAGGPGMPETTVADIAAVPGVGAAQGGVQGYAQFVDKQGDAITPVGPPTLGMSWPSENALSTLEIKQGREAHGTGEVLMDDATAEKHGFAVGDRVEVLLQGPKRTLQLVGIFGHEGGASFAGATLAAFDLDTAQLFFGKGGKVDQVEVAAAEGVSPEELQARLTEALPASFQVQTAAESADELKAGIQQNMGFFTTVLLVFAGIAIFVGAFIIFNTFSIIVAQRMREFGLLRAIGATDRQVMGSVLIEALLVALIASGIGIVLGLGMAMGLKALMDAVGFDLPAAALDLRPRTIVVAASVGVGVTTIAALLPARRAGRISPVAAMQDLQGEEGEMNRRRVIIGSAASAAGILSMGIGLIARVSNEVVLVGIGAFLIFMGIATLSPIFARPLAGTIAWPLPRLFGVPGKLARENARRSPRRTAATAAALMVGLALVTLVGMFAASLKTSMDAALTRTMKADLLVMSQSTMDMQGFTPRIAKELEALPEVRIASPTRLGEWRGTDERTRFLLAVDPRTVGQVMSLDMVSGSPENLADGGVLLRDLEADALGLSTGDSLEMTFGNTGTQEVRVDGVFAAGLDDRYLLSMETYRQNYGQQHDLQVHVLAESGVEPGQMAAAVGGVLERYPNVRALNQAEFREETSAIVDQMLNMVFALLALALIIAVLGITNTLALSIYERKRELGLLRAVGATRHQVRRMIRWEAAVIALFGTSLGVIVGSLFGWALIRSLSDQGFTEIVVPVAQIAVFIVIAGVAGLLAAVLPARRAARIDILEAIAYE